MSWVPQKIIAFFLVFLLLGTEARGQDALDKVIRRRVLRIAADTTIMPWIAQNPRTGAFQGFEYEFALFLAKQLHPEMTVQIIGGDWDKLKLDVKRGKADILMNAWFLPSQEEIESGEIWSECYYNTGLGVLYSSKSRPLNSPEDLKKSRVYIFQDAHALETVKKLDITRYNIITHDDVLIDRIAKGERSYFIYDMPALHYHAGKSQGKLQVWSKTLPGSEGCYSIMASSGGERLIEALNAGIQKLEKEKPTILKRYGFTP